MLQELLAFGRQRKAAPDEIEEPKTEFFLERLDLSRQRRLGNPEFVCGFRDTSVFRNHRKSLQVFQVHHGNLMMP